LIPLGGYFDLTENQRKIKKYESLMQAEDFWSDPDRAKNISSTHQALVKELNDWQTLKQETAYLEEYLNLIDDHQIENDNKDDANLKEIENKINFLEQEFAFLEFSILLSEKHDKNNAIVSLHAGTGGVDAMDWTAMLLRAYLRFAENHGFNTKIIDETVGNEAGIKSVTLEINGLYAYGWLKSEAGVHRLVRISPFDAEKMRHTSFALVEVLPELSETEMPEIKSEDLKIEAFRAGGHGGQSVNTTDSAVRITHLPTGIAVKCQNERSQAQNRASAMKILNAKVLAFFEENKEKDLREMKGEYRRAQWGNQARSYVLNPYRLVKDHRTDYETTEVDRVLDGKFDDFIIVWLKKQLEGKNVTQP